MQHYSIFSSVENKKNSQFGPASNLKLIVFIFTLVDRNRQILNIIKRYLTLLWEMLLFTVKSLGIDKKARHGKNPKEEP